MKRSIFFLCLVLLVLFLPSGLADNGSMLVVNCREWVSLRKSPSADSSRLAKVPLGDTVKDCLPAENSFVFCDYNGIRGYIKAEYLQGDETVSENGFESLETLPACKDLKQVGQTILDETHNGFRIVAQFATHGEYEELMAVCYDRYLKPLWSIGRKSAEPTAQLSAVSAFIAGTTETPLLVVFVSGIGFTAYRIGKTADELWDLPTKQVGGGLSTAIAPDGTIYAVGYHDTAPICISPEGKLLWVGTNDDDACYWPYSLHADTNGVTVTFETGQALRYGADGTLRK